MKKLGLIAGAIVLLIGVLIAGVGLWVREHMEEIAQKMTGKDIHFASLAVSYSPMPAILLTDLALKDGQSTIKIPELKLYPNFGKIFSGQINFKKAVLEDPLILAEGLGAGKSDLAVSEPSPRPPLRMSAIPEGVMVVNRGRLVLQAVQGDSLPVSVTARAEKINQRISIQLESASVEEIGLKFVGAVDVASISPLKLKINATEGTFNPSAVKDFLLKFGYLANDTANQIPSIQRIDSKGLKVEFDAASGNIGLAAETLTVDQTEFQDVTVNLTDGDAFAVRCSQGVLDAGSVYGWFQQTVEGKKLLDGTLARAGLKTLTPEGTIRISSLQLQGRRTETEGGQPTVSLDGSADISVQDLKLELVAENGQEQRFTISQLESTVTIDQGKPSVQINQLIFNSPQGGTGSITGYIPLPVDLKRTTLKSSIDDFKVFDSTLDFHLNKDAHPKVSFDLALNGPLLKVSAEGLFFIPGRNQTDLEARLTHLQISGTALDNQAMAKRKTASLDQPFDASLILNKKLSAKAFVKTVQIGDFTRLQDVDLQLEAINKQAVLSGTIRMCGINLNLGAFILPSSRMVTTLETKGTDVDLTSLVACFSKELPVYLAGRLYITGSFVANGDTPQSLIDGAEGDVTVTVTQAAVQRISGLDPRLSFFLDILRPVYINSDEEDSVAFSRAVVNANLQKGRLVLDRFTLVGPLLFAWGKGEFNIQDKRLKLTGGVRTTLGVTRALDIDRILTKGDT
jgi:hypothetical protein